MKDATGVIAASVLLLGLLGCGGAARPPAGPEPAGAPPAQPASGAATSVPVSGMVVGGGTGVAELLRGRVAGLEVTAEPDGRYHFRIRGMATINETPEPLFLVDGKPVDSGSLSSALAGLTRDDIASVEVLKDVASTSMYGMRAAGGVVIIKTKRR